MRQQIKPTVERLFIGPLRDLVDTTFELITRPASVAREFAEEDGHQFARAVTYFVAAFSAAVILENIARWSLGLHAFSEVAYWTINLLVILSITALAVFIAFVLGSSPPVMLVKSACLAFGAGSFISGFLVAGAALTLAALHELGYIPELARDLTLLENFQQTRLQAYRDCLRNESLLFDFAYQGLASGYQKLNYPLNRITWVFSVILIAATVLFSVLAFYGTERRHWAAALAAILSLLIFMVGSQFGLKVWTDQLEANSPCAARSLQASEQTTGEDYARHLAKNLEELIGRTLKHGATAATVTDVGHRGKSVIFRLQTPTHAEGVEGFKNWADRYRRTAILEYCRPIKDNTSDWTTYSRKLGLSFVWVYRYADTDRVETVVQSPDQCTR